MDKTTRSLALLIVVLTVAAAVGVVVLGIFVPVIAQSGRLFDTQGQPAAFIAAMYVGIAAAAWFLAELLFIMLTVKRSEPFVKRNALALRRMGLACLAAAAALLFLLFYYGWYRHFSIIICVFILLFGVLSTFALSGIFMRAVEYKAENDLTV